MSIFISKNSVNPPFDFDKLDGTFAIDWVENQVALLKRTLSVPNEVPEGPVSLDLDSRKGNLKRIVKLFHQACFFGYGSVPKIVRS